MIFLGGSTSLQSCSCLHMLQPRILLLLVRAASNFLIWFLCSWVEDHRSGLRVRLELQWPVPNPVRRPARFFARSFLFAAHALARLGKISFPLRVFQRSVSAGSEPRSGLRSCFHLTACKHASPAPLKSWDDLMAHWITEKLRCFNDTLNDCRESLQS
jgi:hypothetical protein